MEHGNRTIAGDESSARPLSMELTTPATTNTTSPAAFSRTRSVSTTMVGSAATIMTSPGPFSSVPQGLSNSMVSSVTRVALAVPATPAMLPVSSTASSMQLSGPTHSSKWTAKQKADSKRAVIPPASENYNDWTVDQLKLECTARKLAVAKNTKKEDRVAILNAYDNSKGGIALLLTKQRIEKRSNKPNESEEARRTRHCIFRLVNVLFSEDFFLRFISSGDQLTRKELDEGGSKFWEEVASAFNTTCENYDSLVSDDSLFEGIFPEQITVHSAAKLKSMWKELHSDFSKAEARNKQSGSHEEFWNYCRGNKAVMYLNLWCDVRGAGREFCSGCIYEENEDDSTKESASSSKAPRSNRKRRQSEDPIHSLTDVLSKLVDAESNSELLAERIALARVKRERIQRDSKNEKLTVIDGMLARQRGALESVERQIHNRTKQGMPIGHLLQDEERLRHRINDLQERADNLQTEILDS